VIKAENIKISEQTQFLLSLTPNEIITENIFYYTLMKPGLNQMIISVLLRLVHQGGELYSMI